MENRGIAKSPNDFGFILHPKDYIWEYLDLGMFSILMFYILKLNLYACFPLCLGSRYAQGELHAPNKFQGQGMEQFDIPYTQVYKRAIKSKIARSRDFYCKMI